MSNLLDQPTIQRLLKEAKNNHALFKKEFEKYDNHEDMRSMESWKSTIEWLNGKLT